MASSECFVFVFRLNNVQREIVGAQFQHENRPKHYIAAMVPKFKVGICCSVTLIASVPEGTTLICQH